MRADVDGMRLGVLRTTSVLVGLTVMTMTPVEAATPVFPQGAVTMRVDIAQDGGAPDGPARHTSLSADGSRIAFASTATNLVLGDSNAVADVFVHDFDAGSTFRVSISSDGSEGDDTSGSPAFAFEIPVAISADGTSVAFESDATDLVANDTNGLTDIFVHDLSTMTTTRVSVASDGAEADGVSWSVSISNDGRYVSYISSATTLTSVAPNSGLYVHDRQTGETVLASVAFDGTPVSADTLAVLSGNGRHVAFESAEQGIVPNDTNGSYDVFERNLNTGAIARVSVTSSGAQLVGIDPDEYAPEGPAISFNGRFVAFTSYATNLPPPNGVTGDPNVFVHDRLTGSTLPADVSSLGVGGGDSGRPVMSDDGRYVGFHGVHHLAPCGTNIHGTGFSSFYVRDRVAGTTVRVSTFADGLAAPTGDSIPLPRMDLSADGHVAAYVSDVPLAPDDVDETANVYVHDVFAPVGAPDAAIARGSGPVAGANFCNSTPVFQTRIATLSPGESVSFTVTFGNLSDHPDALLLHGGGGKPGFNVKYFRGKRDVTTGVLAGTRRTRPLEREERVTYRLRVRVRLDADAGDVLAILIRSSSSAQPAVTDVVRARVTVS